MKILMLSDTHYSSNPEDPELKDVLAGQIGLDEKLDRVLHQEDIGSFDFMVVAGDLVHESVADDYVALDALLKKKFGTLPIHYVLGNHDQKDQFHLGISRQRSSADLDYSLVTPEIHFLFLDSAKGHIHSGEFTDRQLAWLDQELKSNELPKVIFQHHPIFGSAYFENFVFEHPQPVMAILSQHQILGIFTGHTHSPATHVQAGMLQYTGYAMSFGIEKLADHSQDFTNTCGYTMITIEDTMVTVAPRIIEPAYTVYKSFSPTQMVELNASYEH